MPKAEHPGRSTASLWVTAVRLAAVLGVFPWSAAAQREPATSPATAWHLVWSDEFDGPDGSAPDAAKWSFDVGGGGWGNNELETYTTRTTNAVVRGGHLVLTARKENRTGPDGVARQYTSARIKTQAHFEQTYGRFEARMQLPAAKGIWPAFWLLGDTIGTAGWPKSGEIDVMENIGNASTVYSTLHGPGYSGGGGISAKFLLPPGETTSAGFHRYAVEWTPNKIRFLFDDLPIAERTPADLPSGAAWVYNHPFFIILDLAVGGNWPGNPDAITTFPQQMLVDYVRVYSRPEPGPGAAQP